VEIIAATEVTCGEVNEREIPHPAASGEEFDPERLKRSKKKTEFFLSSSLRDFAKLDSPKSEGDTNISRPYKALSFFSGK
jgi:hypothetical protein